LVVYRKFIWKVLTFRVKVNRKNWRTISSDLHRIVGVWSLALNVIVFFTGFWMNLFAFEKKTWDNEVVPTPTNTFGQGFAPKPVPTSPPKSAQFYAQLRLFAHPTPP
jgi:uncharacterized iron-regulated membrane protein